MRKELKDPSTGRHVMDVGPGDYVKVGSSWEKIESNTAAGSKHAPRSWTVRTESGRSLGMFEINRYAKAEDFKE